MINVLLQLMADAASNADVVTIFRYAEKLSVVGLLVVLVYILYRRDVKRDEQAASMQNKLFELEKTQIQVIEDFKNSLDKTTEAIKNHILNSK